MQDLIRRSASLRRSCPVAHRSPRRFVDAAGAVLEQLESGSHTTVGSLGSTLLAVSSPLTYPEVRRLGAQAQQRLASVRQRHTALLSEPAAREAGPGPLRRYRVLNGVHGRYVNGVERTFRAGGVMELNDWQASDLLARGQIELAEEVSEGGAAA